MGKHVCVSETPVLVASISLQPPFPRTPYHFSQAHYSNMTPPSTTSAAPIYKEPNLKISTEPFPSPPTFDDKYEAREYHKSRLALAFRVFHKFGLDEGVAGHITLRVGLEPRRAIASEEG